MGNFKYSMRWKFLSTRLSLKLEARLEGELGETRNGQDVSTEVTGHGLVTVRSRGISMQRNSRTSYT